MQIFKRGKNDFSSVYCSSVVIWWTVRFKGLIRRTVVLAKAHQGCTVAY